MNVGIGTEAALFPEKEYIMEIFFAVHMSMFIFSGTIQPVLHKVP
jgi:hypothetical protein